MNILWWFWERVVRGTVSVSLTLRGRDDTALTIQGRDDTSLTIRGRDDTALTIRGGTVAAYRDITIHQGERRSFTITDVDCTGTTVKGTVRDGSAGTQLAQSTATIDGDGEPTVVFTAAQTQTFPDGSDDGLDQKVHEYDICRTTSGQEAVLLSGKLTVRPSPTLGA